MVFAHERGAPELPTLFRGKGYFPIVDREDGICQDRAVLRGSPLWYGVVLFFLMETGWAQFGYIFAKEIEHSSAVFTELHLVLLGGPGLGSHIQLPSSDSFLFFSVC